MTWTQFSLIIGMLLFVKIPLDNPFYAWYAPLHPHMCFEHFVKESWEVDPLGRIEQVGVERILVTMGKDRLPLAAKDAYMYGFTMTKGEFHHSYKEVPCVESR